MNKYIAEAFGTFMLVFFGTGAIVTGLSHLGVSIVFGLIIMVMVYSLSNVSGAHINPAVSIGLWAAGKIKIKDAFFYAIYQIGGAIMASLILYYFFPQHKTLGATIPAISKTKTFLLEIVLTFTLMFVILGVGKFGDKIKSIISPVAIGSTVCLASLFAGNVTGASMNPARSIGPAIATLNFEYLWIYIVAPITGATPAYLLLNFITTDCEGRNGK